MSRELPRWLLPVTLATLIACSPAPAPDEAGTTDATETDALSDVGVGDGTNVTETDAPDAKPTDAADAGDTVEQTDVPDADAPVADVAEVDSGATDAADSDSEAQTDVETPDVDAVNADTGTIADADSEIADVLEADGETADDAQTDDGWVEDVQADLGTVADAPDELDDTVDAEDGGVLEDVAGTDDAEDTEVVDASVCTFTCDTPGAIACADSAMRTCLMDADGCLNWGPPTACSTDATCAESTLGGACACNPGYAGDGLTCVELGSLAWSAPNATPSPTALCGSDDASADAGFQTTVGFVAAGITDGTVVTVYAKETLLPVGNGTAIGEAASALLTLGEGETTVAASCKKPSGNTATTAETRTFLVDTLPPIVAQLQCDGDSNLDGYLNHAEDADKATAGIFEMTCTALVSDASADGRLLTLRVDGVDVGAAQVLGNQATVQVAISHPSSPTLVALSARVDDACGNLGTSGALWTATVDTALPQVALQMPTSGWLLAANDVNPATEQTLECCQNGATMYAVQASSSGATGTASLRLNGVPVADAAIAADGSVSFAGVSLPQGPVLLSVVVVDAAGNGAESATVEVFVDSVVPKLSVEGPVAPVSGLVDLNIVHSDLEAGRVIELYDGDTWIRSLVAAPGPTEGTRSVATKLILQPGQHLFKAKTSDLHGNPGQSLELPVVVPVGAPPLVTVQSPAGNPIVLNATDGVVQGTTLTLTVVATTPAPEGSPADLLIDAVVVASTTVVAGGQTNTVTFPNVTLTDGQTGSLRVRVRLAADGTTVACPGDANNFCSEYAAFSVDVSPPALTFAATPCKAFWSLADANGPVFPIAFATDAEDGSTVHFTSTVGAVDETALVLNGVSSFGGLTFAEGDQTLTATTTDASGNSTTTTCNVQVDLTPPTIDQPKAVRSLDRRDAVVLSFTMPGDDGTVGAVASYEVRYRTCAIGGACPLTGVEFATATAVASLPDAVTPGTTVSLVVDSLPVDVTAVFAVRATDDAGNVSTLGSVGVALAWSTASSAGNAAETEYGASLAYASLRGAVPPDVVIGRPGLTSNKGGFRVVYGDGSTPTDISAAQIGLAAVTSARLGRAVARAGDLDGDGYEDILVGAPMVANAACTAGGASMGTAFLFFGGPTGVAGGAAPVDCASVGATAACYVKISPPVALGVCGFGQSLTGLPSSAGGVVGGRAMFAVGAGDLTATSSHIGKVFVFRVVGDRPNVTIELAETITGDPTDYHFGASLCSPGDMNGDGHADLVIGATRKGQASVVAGRAYFVAGGTRFSLVGLNENTFPDQAAVGIVPLGNQIAADYFGSSCSGAGDLDGDGFADVVISAPGSQKLYVVRGRANLGSVPSMSAPDVLMLSNANWAQPGEVSAGFDMNGDGLPDIAVGDTSAVYLLAGDAKTTVKSTPLAVFSQIGFVSTGHPVLLTPSLYDAALGEKSFPDVVIGRTPGPSVTVLY